MQKHPIRHKKPSQSGITLVEISIALIILGLLTAVLVAGEKVRNAAITQSVVREIKEMESSFIRFEGKYQQLPGDMSDAYDYWGNDCALEADCNGDGGEFIDNAEGYRGWQHLQLAGMLGGDALSGTSPAGGFSGQLGADIPVSELQGAGYFILSRNEAINGVNFSGHYLLLGFPRGGIAVDLLSPALTPSQAKEIDGIIDDGDSDTGRLRREPNVALPDGDDPEAEHVMFDGCEDQDDGNYDVEHHDPSCAVSYRIMRLQ